jgi:glucose-1-phosphate thymidylyltransferase
MAIENIPLSFSKKLKPSKRKELEIVDLIKKYLKIKKLKVEFMGRGSAWLDTGNAESLFETSQFISNIEKRQGIKIACLEEIAYGQDWITLNQLSESILKYKNSSYGEYLARIV